MPSVIDKSFRRITGLPCWGVRWDPQTNLSMSFGRPHLEIREPRPTSAVSAKVRRLFSHRLVVVRGRWWLWIGCAYWTLSLPGALPVTGSGSRRAIDRALRCLDGQCLRGVSVDPRHGKTELCFDLGAVRRVRRWKPPEDGDLWTLYEPDGRALAVRGDGQYTHENASAPSRYRPLP